MILVLFLVSLIVGLSSLHLANRLPSARLQSTAREISSALRQARLLARTGNQEKFFIVDMDGRQYGMHGAPLKNIPAGINVKVLNASAGEAQQGKYFFLFRPSGVTACDRIVLWDDKRTLSIQLDPVTGTAIVR